MSSSESPPHVALLPFMAKGHTIPLLHLTRLLSLRRSDITITIFTTHANSPFIRQFLSGTRASISYHLSVLVPFPKATKFLQPEFDAILETLRPNVSCIISDGFLHGVFYFEPEFSHPEPGEHTDFYTEEFIATQNSHGIIMNSFRELEPEFPGVLDHSALHLEKRSCSKQNSKPMWIQWLDEMSGMQKPVLYVAFGSVIETTIEQYREIATGLENSGEQFLWVLRFPSFDNDEFMVEFEERVKGRGLLVKNEWCVHGFMSHCVWNSVLESICESVPMLGFPITADQHLNARMVVEYFRIGVKVVTGTGSVSRIFRFGVYREENEKWKGMFKNVKKLSEKARDAMEVGGSSWHTLDLLIDEVICGKKLKDSNSLRYFELGNYTILLHL
ncbi:hypothetical protein MKX01_041051 [Papaver californicum]|nr:hypothetical protein MKX01_041051 [Papaver californicum]